MCLGEGEQKTRVNGAGGEGDTGRVWCNAFLPIYSGPRAYFGSLLTGKSNTGIPVAAAAPLYTFSKLFSHALFAHAYRHADMRALLNGIKIRNVFSAFPDETNEEKLNFFFLLTIVREFREVDSCSRLITQ